MPSTAPEDPPATRAHARATRAARTVVASAWASNIGDGIRLVALPLLTATLTDRAVLIAAVVAATMLPGAVLGAPLGVVIDRVDRRRVALAADIGRAVVAAVLAITVVTDTATVAAVFVAALALGIGETLRDLVGAALVADAVDDADLEAANGQLIAAEAAGNTMLGPVGGALLWTLAKPLPFAADATALVVSASITARLPTPAPRPPVDRPRLRRELGLAWSLVGRNATLRRVGLVSFLLQLSLMAVNAVEVLWARDRLDIGAVGLGALNAVAAAGAILGSLQVGRLTARIGPRALVTGVLAGHAALMALYASTTLVPVVFAGLFLSGVGLTAADATMRATRVRAAGSEHVGRVGGVMRTVIWTGGILGGILGGICTDAFGLVATFQAATAVFVASSAISVLWPPVVLAANPMASEADQREHVGETGGG